MRGGYTLARPPADIPVSLIISAIEGARQAIVQCLSEGPQTCTVFTVCTIKSPLTKVQANIERAFSTMNLSEIV
jgi:DNA-binding IscR family transcriptional regulator